MERLIADGLSAAESKARQIRALADAINRRDPQTNAIGSSLTFVEVSASAFRTIVVANQSRNPVLVAAARGLRIRTLRNLGVMVLDGESPLRCWIQRMCELNGWEDTPCEMPFPIRLVSNAFPRLCRWIAWLYDPELDRDLMITVRG